MESVHTRCFLSHIIIICEVDFIVLYDDDNDDDDDDDDVDSWKRCILH